MLKSFAVSLIAFWFATAAASAQEKAAGPMLIGAFQVQSFQNSKQTVIEPKGRYCTKVTPRRATSIAKIREAASTSSLRTSLVGSLCVGCPGVPTVICEEREARRIDGKKVDGFRISRKNGRAFALTKRRMEKLIAAYCSAHEKSPHHSPAYIADRPKRAEVHVIIGFCE